MRDQNQFSRLLGIVFHVEVYQRKLAFSILRERYPVRQMFIARYLGTRERVLRVYGGAIGFARNIFRNY